MPKNIFTFLPFVAQQADQRKIFLQNRCSYVRRIYTKNGPLSQSEAEKITFPPNLTDRHTDIWTLKLLKTLSHIFKILGEKHTLLSDRQMKANLYKIYMLEKKGN